MFPTAIRPRVVVPVILLLGTIIAAESSAEIYEVSPVANQSDNSTNGTTVASHHNRTEPALTISLIIFSTLLAINAFHMIPKVSTYIPESCLLIGVGIVIGSFTRQKDDFFFTEELFFFLLLPPIIMNTGYSMPSGLFFEHLGTILIFAIIGTIWNSVFVGLSLWGIGTTGLFSFDLPLASAMLFSVIVSAVDPVAVLAIFEQLQVSEILYIIVLGESLLNDAVTVALYHMCSAFVTRPTEQQDFIAWIRKVCEFAFSSVGGTIIGISWGFLTGFVTRFAHYSRDLEPIYICVMCYLAYVTAEVSEVSGILSMTFCCMTMRSYVKANISFKSRTTVKYFSKALSSTSEAIIFVIFGVLTMHLKEELTMASSSRFNQSEAIDKCPLDSSCESEAIDIWFILLSLAFCLISRAISVVVLTFMANRFRPYELDNVEKFVLWYGGLRGAIAFALAHFMNNTIAQREQFLTATVVIIYFTVVLQGISIRPLVNFLEVKLSTKRKKTMNERFHETTMDHIMVCIENVVGQFGYVRIRNKFKRIDNRYIRPFLVRENSINEPKILETYSKLTMKDALELMKRDGSTLALINGAESMAVLFRNFIAKHYGPDHVWNLDTGEFEYRPSGRDLSDTQVRRLLWEPSPKRFSFSRNDEQDEFSTMPQFKYNVRMNIRRMISETVINQQMKASSEEAVPGESRQAIRTDIPQRKVSIQGPPPTAAEMLPWKREDDDPQPVVQSEFPAWAENKDYVSYFSPTNTFLGGLNKSRANHRTVIGFFGRGAMNRVTLLGQNLKRPSKSEPSVAVSIPEEDGSND